MFLKWNPSSRSLETKSIPIMFYSSEDFKKLSHSPQSKSFRQFIPWFEIPSKGVSMKMSLFSPRSSSMLSSSNDDSSSISLYLSFMLIRGVDGSVFGESDDLWTGLIGRRWLDLYSVEEQFSKSFFFSE